MPKPSSSSKYDHSVNPAKPLFVCLTCQGAGYKGEVLWVVSSDKSPVGITHLPFKLNARLSHSIYDNMADACLLPEQSTEAPGPYKSSLLAVIESYENGGDIRRRALIKNSFLCLSVV